MKEILNLCFAYIIALSIFCICQADEGKQECGPTHLEFYSDYVLPKNELNSTFTQVQQKLAGLEDISYKPSQTTFKIQKIKVKYLYEDQNQETNIVSDEEENKIAVTGGALSVSIQFSWNVKNLTHSQSGNGTMTAKSSQLSFVKAFQIEKNLLFFDLVNFSTLQFPSQSIKATIQSTSISQSNKQNLLKMLTPLEGTTVMNQLVTNLPKIYENQLSSLLKAENRPFPSTLQYKYQKGQEQQIIIEYSNTMTNVKINENGLSHFYRINIPDFEQWSCDRPVPDQPYDIKIYGGTQQIISLDVYINTLRYAAANTSVFNTLLNKQSWESEAFQFYAGDLFEVIPKIKQKYKAMSPVSGMCQISEKQISLEKQSDNTFTAIINHLCQLQISHEKIIEFNITAKYWVEVIPEEIKEEALDFYTRNFQLLSCEFYPMKDYKVEKMQLATHMIEKSINNIKNTKVFGSGWRIREADYPKYIIEDNVTVLYDEMHRKNQKMKTFQILDE